MADSGGIDRVIHSKERIFAFVAGLSLALIALSSSGCVSINQSTLRKAAYLAQLGEGSALSVRRTPSNPLENELNLLGWKGPKPSERTIQILRRYDLEQAYQQDPVAAFEGLRAAASREARLETTYAVAEVAYVLGKKAAAGKNPDQAMTYFGEALITSYEYLFDPRFDPYRNAYDPQFRGICDLYNVSLEEILRLMSRESLLTPDQVGTVTLADRTMQFEVRMQGRWADYEVDHFEFVSDYEVEGLANRYHTYGLGVPLIAIRKPSERPEPDEQYFPEGLTFPLTAFFRRVDSVEATANTPGAPCHCVLELYDPLDRSDIEIGRRRTPLESDISTPLAYYLNDPVVGTNALATFALLDANFAQDFDGLYMLEPFDPSKIPVVMVHGLWSSPVTWMEMFNDLRSMPEIRQNYQFWFYMYPSGQPFWKSAEQMRSDLAEAVDNLDPHGQSPQLERMVLVGHSMGGLVSRLQTIDSQDKFWQLVSDRPIEELNVDETERRELQQVLYFHPNPSVGRVITIGTPHRGSRFANSTTRWISHKLFELPSLSTQANQQVIRNNPDFFSNTDLLTINTSVDSLSPESPFLPVMLEAPKAPWVKYHNIIGVVEDRSLLAKAGLSFQQPGDGLVPLESARVDDVDSELIVPAPHMTVHQHPLAILEVRRILLQHLAEGATEIRVDRSIVPVGYEQMNDEPISDPSSNQNATEPTFDFGASQPLLEVPQRIAPRPGMRQLPRDIVAPTAPRYSVPGVELSAPDQAENFSFQPPSNTGALRFSLSDQAAPDSATLIDYSLPLAPPNHQPLTNSVGADPTRWLQIDSTNTSRANPSSTPRR